MMVKSRKERKEEMLLKEVEERIWPTIDFNNSRTRNGFMIFSIGTVIFIMLSSVGSYEAFHYTKSVEFCGTLCHDVMEPEYVAFQNSSHARVACVECHVGSGASWFVKSKLSGLYQVYAVIAQNFPKPIPTPISNLRPARETCEECHWPEKFYSHNLREEKHYLTDTDNTSWDITLKMKMGASSSALGLEEGIHWHINPDVRIEYKATSFRRASIPWVKYTNAKTGEIIIYQDQENLLEEAKLDSLLTSLMDCMDCHNRPSHDYKTPIRFINDAMTAGKIPQDLPDIKYVAMDVLGKEYVTMDTTLLLIKSDVYEYYEMNYEDLFTDKRDMIDQAIAGISEEFRKNIFPYMKVSWASYPNHIGHLEFEGCFRCHNDRHESPEGRVISKDCNLCHTIIEQRIGDSLQIAGVNEALEFYHYDDEWQSWKTELCSECHLDMY
jgi:hypothetical protein